MKAVGKTSTIFPVLEPNIWRPISRLNLEPCKKEKEVSKLNPKLGLKLGPKLVSKMRPQIGRFFQVHNSKIEADKQRPPK